MMKMTQGLHLIMGPRNRLIRPEQQERSPFSLQHALRELKWELRSITHPLSHHPSKMTAQPRHPSNPHQALEALHTSLSNHNLILIHLLKMFPPSLFHHNLLVLRVHYQHTNRIYHHQHLHHPHRYLLQVGHLRCLPFPHTLVTIILVL